MSYYLRIYIYKETEVAWQQNHNDTAMKSFLTILFVAAGLTLTAQTVFPDNGEWNQKYHSIAWGHGGVVLWDYTVYKRYSINGDSISGDTRYMKLFINQNFTGYLKIDSQQVRYGSNADSMYLLFDFGLNPGDTFTFHASSYSYGILQATVSAVDTVIIKGEYRKRIKFTSFPGYNTGAEWIEGIGDVNFGGIELDYSYVAWWANTTSLVCFSENGQNIYGTCTLGINDMEHQPKAWPNPTDGIIAIDLNYTGQSIKIELYDARGSLVLTDICNNTKAVIDLSALSRGVYYLAIYENSIKFCRKIIKN